MSACTLRVTRRRSPRVIIASLRRSLARRDAQVRTLNAACCALLTSRRPVAMPPAALMRMHADAQKVPALEREVERLRRALSEATAQARAALREVGRCRTAAATAVAAEGRGAPRRAMPVDGCLAVAFRTLDVDG